MKTVSFYTLGCKLNQSETASLMSQFRERGYDIVPFGSQSDVCIINSCTVTGKTDLQCRQIIRKARRISPHARIALVGCYAQVADNLAQRIKEVDVILGSDKKFDIFKYLENNQSGIEIKADHESYFAIKPGVDHERTRAFLKIQDGCNNFCSYCIVPYARGRSRSAQFNQIIQDAQQLIEQGYKEIVLTGVHIGQYGKDLMPQSNLITLLKSLEKIPGLGRIRLTSLEPMELSEELIDFTSQTSKVCPHFHVPLQHGDDVILKQMKRNYSIAEYVKRINYLMARIPQAGLGTDIIVGFPGEEDNQFQNTYRIVQELPFSYLHVFAYSSRPGTNASSLEKNINPHVIKQRSALLIELGKQKKKIFYQQAVGKRFQVLFEQNVKDESMFGFTENYIRVKAPKQSNYFNEIVMTEIDGLNGKYALGQVVL